MSERTRFADFHQDRLNPWLAEILDNPEFQYASERQKQLPREGLRLTDLTFASIYRRATDEIKAAAQTGNEEVLERVRQEFDRIIDYYHATNDFHVLKKPKDLGLGVVSKDARDIVIHLEGGDIITSPDVVDALYERGVRSVGPLYSHDNLLGGGSSGNVHRGLTPLGKRVIDRMVELRMIIDLAHANRKTAHDILERVDAYGRTVASHTGIGTTQRTLSIPLLKKIAANGGVVGFTPANVFFPNFTKYIDTFKRASDLTGSVGSVAVGTDFGGLDAKHLFQEFDEIGKMSRVAEALSEQGDFSDEDIAKIMYGNVARVVERL